jgi:hypothetical protein
MNHFFAKFEFTIIIIIIIIYSYYQYAQEVQNFDYKVSIFYLKEESLSSDKALFRKISVLLSFIHHIN